MPRAAADRQQHPAEHGPQQRAEREVQEVDDAGRGAAQLRRVGFLDDRVRQHRRARRDAGRRGRATYGGKTSAGPYRIHARHAEQHARRSRRSPACGGRCRSEIKPSSGQPMIQPNGTRRRAHHRRRVLEAASLLQVADAPDHVEDRRRDEEQARDHAAQDRLRIPKDGRRGLAPAACIQPSRRVVLARLPAAGRRAPR